MKIKFVFFAFLAAFCAAFILSCDPTGNDPWEPTPSSSSAANSGPAICAGQEYDTALFECKSGELVGKCKGVDYYPTYQTCENGVIKDGSSLSSGSADNTPQMCGGVSYDPTAFRCETGELIGKCMGKDYYVAFQSCSNGTIVNKNSSSSVSSSSVGTSSSGGVSSSSNIYDKVCGGINYDSNVFRCEGGELIGRCMGKDYYPAYQVCNNGEIETKNDCKGVSFTPSEQFCSVQDSLIYNKCNNATYNTNTQDCCNNKIYTLGEKQCKDNILLLKCGDLFYNDSTEFCYNNGGNKVYSKCNDSTYNAITHGCKDNVITPKCGEEFYNTSTEFCSAQETVIYNKCNGSTFNTTTHGCCNNALYAQSTHGCKNNVITPRCNGEFYDNSTQFCSAQETKVYSKCDGEAFNTTMQGCCGNSLYSFAAQTCNNGVITSKIVTGTFTDSRDSKVYKWTKIGDKTWMAENLNYKADNSKCYSDMLANCETYGRLYNFNTAKTVCPTGWHLPTKAEWTTLIDHVGGSSTAGKFLRASGADEYKFSALMGGGYSSYFFQLNEAGYMWTSTATYVFGIWSNSNEVGTYNQLNSIFYSVRCAKD